MSTNNLKKLRNEYLEAEQRLLSAVAETCPGFHAPRQHRDAQPPWCDHCGRTRLGSKVGEPR